MSLTFILSSSFHRELKDKLREFFPRPTFTLVGKIFAEPKSKNHALIGTAFDYLLRFHLERINKNYTIKRSKWIAASALEKLKKSAETSEKNKNIKSAVDINWHQQRSERLKARYLLAKSKYEEANECYNQFLEDGILSDKLIISTIFLAKLDAFFRIGLIEDTMVEYEDNDVNDLKNLISIVPFLSFTATNKCYLNPTFGEGSTMVGGADADIIIDDTLYDFKVVKELKLERENLNQIICYYVLSQIGGVNENKNDKPIKNIGIYFARHGVILKFCIADFNTSDKILEFIEWFPQYIKNNTPYGFALEGFEKKTESRKRTKNKSHRK